MLLVLEAHSLPLVEHRHSSFHIARPVLHKFPLTRVNKFLPPKAWPIIVCVYVLSASVSKPERDGVCFLWGSGNIHPNGIKYSFY